MIRWVKRLARESKVKLLWRIAKKYRKLRSSQIPPVHPQIGKGHDFYKR